MRHLYENYFQLNSQFLVPWILAIMFSNEAVIRRHWEKEQTHQIIKSIPKDIQECFLQFIFHCFVQFWL